MWFSYQLPEEQQQKAAKIQEQRENSRHKRQQQPPSSASTSSENTKIDRVDSSAMQSLAAYSSDEEGSPTSGGGPRRRTLSAGSKKAYEASLFGLEGADFLVPQKVAESRITENPEAPPSREGSADIAEDKAAVGNPEAEISPENRTKQHNFDEDSEFSPLEERLKEPPPPARPHFFQSPSPAPGLRSVSQSPSLVRPNSAMPGSATKDFLSSKMEPTRSAVSLVSYGAEEEELDQSKLSDKGDKERRYSAPLEDEKNSLPSHEVKLEEGEREDLGMDVDEELEKALEEEKAAGDWTTGSDGGDSPASLGETNSGEIPIPAAPLKPCSQELIDRFHMYFQQKARGMDFNMSFQRRKDFRNPSIYEKLIEHFGIDELGSNFHKSVFDPHGFKPYDYYDKLAEAQKIAMDKLEKDKKQKTADTADKKHPPTSVLSEGKSRKSKWDVPTTGGGSGPHQASAGKASVTSSSEPNKKSRLK